MYLRICQFLSDYFYIDYTCSAHSKADFAYYFLCVFVVLLCKNF